MQSIWYVFAERERGNTEFFAIPMHPAGVGVRSNTGWAWVKLEEEAGDFFGQKKLNINKHANDTSKISTKPETDKQGHEQLSLEYVENPDPNMKNEDGRNNLECKRKYGEYISKDSVRLSRDGYDAILGGEFDFLLSGYETLGRRTGLVEGIP